MFGLAAAIVLCTAQGVQKPEPGFAFVAKFKGEITTNPFPPEKPDPESVFSPRVMTYIGFRGNVEEIRSAMRLELPAYGFRVMKNCFGGWEPYAQFPKSNESTGVGRFHVVTLWWSEIPDTSRYSCYLVSMRDPTEGELALLSIGERFRFARVP